LEIVLAQIKMFNDKVNQFEQTFGPHLS